MTDQTIDYTAAHITMLEMQVIELRAKQDTLERENATLRRQLAAALSEIESDGVFLDGFASGANLRAIADLSAGFPAGAVV